MATLKVYDLNKNEVGSIELADEVFAAEVNTDLFYEVVKWQLAKRRAGTHKAKSRGEISATKAKLFRQKGTGRARRGSLRAPGLRGGGVVFGPKPRDYGYSLPKRVRKGALISALSLRSAEEKMIVLDKIELAEIKTKTMAGVLRKFGLTKPLFVDDGNDTLVRSTRNIPGADVLPTVGLNVYDILRHNEIVLTEEAIKKVEGVLKP